MIGDYLPNVKSWYWIVYPAIRIFKSHPTRCKHVCRKEQACETCVAFSPRIFFSASTWCIWCAWCWVQASPSYSYIVANLFLTPSSTDWTWGLALSQAGVFVKRWVWIQAIAIYHRTANNQILRRTYLQAADRARGFAYFVKKRKYNKVGILCPNTPAFLEAIFGTGAAGAINIGMSRRISVLEQKNWLAWSY